MKRTLLKIGIALMAVGIVVAAATAMAQHAFGPHAMHRRVARFIDGALGAAKVDPQQRRAVEASRDRALSALQSIHEQRRGEMKEALALFEADTLDGARIKAIRDARLGDMQRAGDAIATALTEAHDALRPEQRKAVADYIRTHKPSHRPGFRAEMMKHFASARIDDLLDEVDATDAQRAAIEAARDHVFAAVEQSLGSAEFDVAERAIALFSADRVDAAQIQALRAEHQLRAERIADAVVQATHDIHDALTPTQRRVVAGAIRAHAGRFGHHGGDSHEG